MKDFCKGCIWVECKETLPFCEDKQQSDDEECDRYMTFDDDEWQEDISHEACE